MRNIKRMAALLGSFLLTASMVLPVFADDGFQIGVDQYRVNDGKIYVYVNEDVHSNAVLDGSNTELLVGKQKLAIEGSKQFKATDEAITYDCIIDVSGSMDNKRIDQAKEIINNLMLSMDGNDQIQVSAMGDEMISSGFSTDRQYIKEYLDGIKVTKQDTNLYKSLVDELGVLMNSKEVSGKRCLIIFSDGAEDQATGITREEADAAVKTNHIPIFTVALLKNSPSKAQLESAKILGSFGRTSAGGIHFAPVVEDTPYSEIAPSIAKVMNDSYILEADLADAVLGDDNVIIEVTAKNGSTQSKDAISVPAGRLKEIQDGIEIAIKRKGGDQEEEEPSIGDGIKTPSKQEKEEEKPDYGKYYILGGVAAALLLIALLLMATSRKGSDEEENEDDDDLMNDNEFSRSHNTISPGVGAASGPVIAAPPVGGNDSVTIPLTPPAGGASAPIDQKAVLTRMGHSETEKYDIDLKKETTIGRSSACTIKFTGDKALSGTHCKIYSKDNLVYIEDNNSTNGTFVNGVPIVGKLAIHPDDILMIGSREYRIYWK